MTGPQPQRVKRAWDFFPPSKHSNSQEVRYSARQTSRSLRAGMWLWANRALGAKFPWILVSSRSGFGELGKDGTCPGHLFLGSNQILQTPGWILPAWHLQPISCCLGQSVLQDSPGACVGLAGSSCTRSDSLGKIPPLSFSEGLI